MSASGPGSKFGAEFPAEHDDDKPIMTDNEYTRGVLDGFAIKDAVKDRAGGSPDPASPPSRERLIIVLEHNRDMLKELLAERSDFTFPAVYAAEIETIRACEYLDGFVKGLEYALGIKPKNEVKK
jgi:hypothetical protein